MVCICSVFQFHIGMINPMKIEVKSNKNILFQFHIGMINPKKDLQPTETVGISIPHWYD